MSIRKTFGRRVFEIINGSIMLFLIFVCIMPLLHVLWASFSEPYKLAAHTGILLKPLGFTLKGYKLIFSYPAVIYSYANTIFYVVTATALNIILTALGAYALSRKNFMFAGSAMMIITFTMFFSGGLIPFYLVCKNIGLIDNRLSMILPGAISVFNLIIMRTAFLAVPDSLVESAKIDGANDFTILFKVVLPVAKAVIAVIILFYAVGHWNSWFNAMLFLRTRTKYPLQLILKELLIQSDTSQALKQVSVDSSGNLDQYKMLVKYTAIVIATAPILLIYPFIQKYFVEGVMIGSIKG